MRVREGSRSPGALGSPERYADRRDAGRRLAMLLSDFRYEDPVVVGVAADGMPVAAEVASALQAPLELVAVCELTAPAHPAHPVGALAEGDITVIDDRAVRQLGLSADGLAAVVARARRELSARLARHCETRLRLAVAGRTVLLVDDGLPHPHRAQAAVSSLRRRGAARIVLATPVGTPEAGRGLCGFVDDVVCVALAERWPGRGCYRDPRPTAEDEVSALLKEPAGAVAREVAIDVESGLALRGELTVPWGAHGRGLVVFAHGGGSDRLSPRSRQTADELNEAGFATLSFDLLSRGEQGEDARVFGMHRAAGPDLPLLAGRLVEASRWLRRQPETARLALGYFGAGRGAAVSLLAAADLGAGVRGLVSCGGRPDLARGRLAEVLAPVLLIVGGAEPGVLEINRRAQARLRCESQLALVGGATSRFGEPGAPEHVGRLTIDWFTQHLCQGASGPGSAEHDAGLSLSV